MRFFFLPIILLFGSGCFGATIAIIDTGFDLDHDFLKPKIHQTQEGEDKPFKFMGVDLKDNSHLNSPVVEDHQLIQEILRYRELRARGHREGLSLSDFEWFKQKNADKNFMEKLRLFKKHSHGTFVAGIALREGKNINIYPIRGLIPNPVVAVDDTTPQGAAPLKAKTPEERFKEEVQNSLDRATRKFAKICAYIAKRDIQIVNASYGITYKSIVSKFREKHREIVGSEIDEATLLSEVNNYFQILYERGERTISKYPQLLFVFSAGNSGLDNDRFHHYPSRIKLPNTISVAAMNGDYLASFSNYGHHVDIGAPGVGIKSLLPRVYTEDGQIAYSPASGTSMAAPYISNLAAQILNINPKLTPPEIKKIILSTGEEKLHLRPRLLSGAIVSNEKALRAAVLTKDHKLDEAITLAQSTLMQVEDKISIGHSPAVSPESLKQKVLETIPQAIAPHEVDDESSEQTETTKSPSASEQDQEKAPQDSSEQHPSEAPAPQENSADPDHSNQTVTPLPPPSVEMPASSSESEPSRPEVQSPESDPSSLQ